MNGNIINYASIGKRIRDRRREMRMNQAALAKQVGVSGSFIGHLERGAKKPSVETVAQLCDTLDVTADYLLFGRRYVCDRENCNLFNELNVLINGERNG